MNYDVDLNHVEDGWVRVTARPYKSAAAAQRFAQQFPSALGACWQRANESLVVAGHDAGTVVLQLVRFGRGLLPGIPVRFVIARVVATT